jgi:uncharacterized RDD family membrane protein YckC
MLEIRTSDGVVFSIPVAGPVHRFLALAIDFAVISTGSVIVVWILSIFLKQLPDIQGAVGVLLYFVISMGYGIAMEWFGGGRTLGKRVMQLRVVDALGLRLTFAQVLLRNLVRAVDSLPVLYLLGGMVCVINPRMQRLGDMAAGTLVIRTRLTEIPELPVESYARQNSLREYRTLAARLRIKIEPAQARLALEALRRRDALEPAARLELFAVIAADFRKLVEFPEETTLFLTDEQYVRDVVEILFARNGSARLARTVETPVAG